MELGTTVRDKITGFTGIVTGLVNYISGCNQALVVPRAAEDNTFKEGQWFDLQRLAVVDAPTISLENGTNPGPDRAPPRRS